VEAFALERVTRGNDREEARSAAAIWARAKARRDGEQNDASVEEALLGIQRRLTLDGAQLLLGRRGGVAAGFALFAPNASTIELYYLAVDPDDWGSGVASELLTCVDAEARALGFDALQLWVIDDNQRAIAVYERAGWISTAQTKRDTSSSRLERRFVKRLQAASSP
jgi:ribosomal protein S18 acetylase RimI-like enzyme